MNETGTAGDSLSRNNGVPFSTEDADYDGFIRNCAIEYRGAWWYSNLCGYSNLNGPYHKGGIIRSGGQGITWAAWKGFKRSAKRAEMKLHPTNSYTPVN